MLKRVSNVRFFGIWSRLYQRGLFSSISSRKKLNLPTSEQDRPLPPRKPLNCFLAYIKKRFKQTGEKLTLTIIAREWREMDPQQKAKFEEEFLTRREEYQRQMEEFSKNFRLYRLITGKKRRINSYHIFGKDQASKLPKEQRADYIQCKAKEEYKNLTTEELKAYQEMADNINKENKVFATQKPNSYDAMRKERAAKLPKEERFNYILNA